MKTRNPIPAATFEQRSFKRGFTLTEVLIATTTFLLLVAGILSANVFGLRLTQIAQTKLNTSDASRRLVGRLADDIRGSTSVWVGSLSNGVFCATLDGEPQVGTALMIYPTTNTSNYKLYYLNRPDQTFRQTTSAGGSPVVLAQQVTNTTVFSVQDCLGTTLTNSQNNRVIHFNLEFFAAQPYLPTPDYYQLETSVTKRSLD
jgi:hypothetical protein